jgi:nucleoside-diphosphate-sugar epimerase
MPDNPIPLDLQIFIVRHIDSIAQIEALLLLRRHAPEKWDLASTSQRLYISEQETLEILENLCEEGIYHFACRTPETEQMVKRLAEAYAENLIAVTNIIHGKPRRIREFANAFKLRKDRG